MILQLVYEKQQLQLQVSNLSGTTSQDTNLNFQDPTTPIIERSSVKSTDLTNNSFADTDRIMSTKVSLESFSVNDQTAKEIVQLLQEVEATSQTANSISKDIETRITTEQKEINSEILIPCAFCVGRLQEI